MEWPLENPPLEHLLEVARSLLRELVVRRIVASAEERGGHTREGERCASSGVHLLQPGSVFGECICTPARPVYQKARLEAAELVIAISALPLCVAPARRF
eukprot:332400-Prorocentrum_minimum.AAC.2